LVELVHKYGTKNWRFVASHLQGRLPKQCRERYCNQLDPNIKKDVLTPKEWKIVHEAHERFGNKWFALNSRHIYSANIWAHLGLLRAEIAKLVPGRTANHIKNQWNTMLRRASVDNVKKRKSRSSDESADELDEESSWDPEDDTDTAVALTRKDDKDWIPATKRQKRDSSNPNSIDEQSKQDTGEDDYPGGEPPILHGGQVLSAATASTASLNQYPPLHPPPQAIPQLTRIDPTFIPWGAYPQPTQFAHTPHGTHPQFTFPMVLPQPMFPSSFGQLGSQVVNPMANAHALPPNTTPNRRNSLFTALVDASCQVLSESGKPVPAGQMATPQQSPATPAVSIHPSFVFSNTESTNYPTTAPWRQSIANVL